MFPSWARQKNPKYTPSESFFWTTTVDATKLSYGARLLCFV